MGECFLLRVQFTMSSNFTVTSCLVSKMNVPYPELSLITMSSNFTISSCLVSKVNVPYPERSLPCHPFILVTAWTKVCKSMHFSVLISHPAVRFDSPRHRSGSLQQCKESDFIVLVLWLLERKATDT